MSSTDVPESSAYSSFPNPSGPPSIISSRMTDIASDDGDEQGRETASRSPPNLLRQSIQSTADGRSRPDTGTTGVSSQRNPWTQSPPSRNASRNTNTSNAGAQRSSVQGSTTSSIPGRPRSAASRTHVPSLQSHAFFKPMSSQRLQAQRGGSRPVAVTQATSDDAENGNGTPRQSVQSNLTNRAGPSPVEDGDMPPPPSRGTEMTEQETAERVTANTSPTQGHYATGSLTESVRPLQRNAQNINGLSLNTDKSYKNGGGLPAPSKSPRSFRSSFLIPTRAEPVVNPSDRNTNGREKLASIASTVATTPTGHTHKVPKLGKNHQYFQGNTRFWAGGRLQNARDRPVNIATGLFVLVPGVLFFVFSAPWLWHNISPAIPIVFAYVFYICMSSFIHASVSDPGVSPH
jgi:palmitoyltransferase ZDHHC9/14/18